MGWTTVKTWASGDTPTAAEFNTYVRDNLDFIMNTAMKKLASVANSYSSTITIGNSEITVQALDITDPVFPSISYAYIAYGSFICNPNEFGGTPSDLGLKVRDNALSGSIIGYALYRNLGQNDRFTLSVTCEPVTVASGDRSAFFGCVANRSDTFDVNYAGQISYQGALLAPI